MCPTSNAVSITSVSMQVVALLLMVSILFLLRVEMDPDLETLFFCEKLDVYFPKLIFIRFSFSRYTGIEKNLKLEEYHTEPSRKALYNYGNTSSSSIWYELEYIHYHQRNNPLKKGDRIMQVAFGSGFKCTSGVWLKV